MYVVPSPSTIRVGQTEPQLLTLIRCSTAVIVLLSLDALKAWRATPFVWLCMSLLSATVVYFLLQLCAFVEYLLMCSPQMMKIFLLCPAADQQHRLVCPVLHLYTIPSILELDHPHQSYHLGSTSAMRTRRHQKKSLRQLNRRQLKPRHQTLVQLSLPYRCFPLGNTLWH